MGAFSPSLTTQVFSRGSMGRFEATLRRAAPKGNNLHLPCSIAPSSPPTPGSPSRSGHTQTIENARLILVASGILPARNELSHRYETWAHQVLATVEPASERWLLLQFHRDQVLPS